MAEVTEQIVREAPEIERIRMQLLEAAKAQTQAPVTLPAYQVAGMSPEQVQALQMGVSGIGAYQPYMTQGSQALTSGMGAIGESADILRAADTRNQFAAAQEAYNRAIQPAEAMGNLANVAGAGMGLIGAGAQGISGAQDLALQYAQANMGQSLGALGQAQQVAQAAGPSDFTLAGAGLGSALGTAAGATQAAQQAVAQPGFQQGIGALYAAAQQAQQAGQLGSAPMVSGIPGVTAPQMAAAQTGYAPGLQAFQMGPAERVTSGTITEGDALSRYMSPYMQQVVDIQTREAQRQADIAAQQRGAQAAQMGAFGGTRQAIMEAEAARNLAQQKGDIQAQGLQMAFQQAQQQFNAEEQARMAAQQANQQAGMTVGAQNLASQLGVQQLGAQTGLQTALANLSSQQQANVQNQAAQLQAQGMNQQAALQAALANQQAQSQYGLAGAQMGQQAAQMLGQAGQAQIGASGQQAQLGLAAAAQQFQQAGFDANTAMQLAQLQQTQQQQALQQSQLLQGIGGLYGQQALQQAQLGQSAAGLYGQLGAQQAGLSSLYGNIAGQQAGILGQQSQLQQAIGSGIGSLAGQQFNIGAQQAAGLGSLGTQLGNLGVQQAALGQTQQQLGQGDVNFLYNLGSTVQRQTQAELDAQRATAMQTAMQPYQNIAFLSDIYKGAPSTQMALTSQATPAPSPFQQIAGLATGAAATAKALSI